MHVYTTTGKMKLLALDSLLYLELAREGVNSF